MKYRLLAISIAVAALAGCGQTSVPEAKQQAYNRWYRLRADMLCGMASEHLKVGLLDKAEAKAIEALVLDSTYAPAYRLLGKIYIEQGRYGAAIKRLNKACELDPESAEGYYLLAVAQEKNNCLDEALKNYRYAYHLDNSTLAAVTAACEVMVAMGQVQQAQDYLDRHMPKAENDPGIFELAGRLAMMTARYSEAAKFFEIAYDLDPKNRLYLEKLARAQFLAGRYDQATESLGKLLASKDHKPSVWMYMMLGDAHLALNQPHQARMAYQSASRLDGSSAEVWAAIAKADLALGDSHRAVLAARRSLLLDKNNLSASMLLGYALLTERQVPQALTHLTEATRRHPKDATLWCLLGRAHAAAGNEARATRCYVKAVNLDPQCTLARELLEAPIGMEVSKMN